MATTLPFEDWIVQARKRPANDAYSTAELLDYYERTYGQAPAEVEPPKEEQGDFKRGFKQGFTQLKQLGGGAAFALGDSLDMPGLAQWGLDVYKRGEEETQAQSRESDSFSNVMEGKGDWLDFLQYASGYVTSQGVQAVATGGLGAVGGKMIVGQVIKGYAEKKAAELVAQGIAKEVAEREAAQAVTAILAKAAATGGTTALAGSNFAQEAGEIYPGAAEQAQAEGREMDTEDRFRAFSSAAGAAALETIADRIGINKVLKGGAGSTVAGRLAREVPAGMAREGATEAAQTAIETYGQGKPLEGEEFTRGMVDSAALGAVGGGLVGGAVAVRGQADPLAQAAPEIERLADVEQRAAAETVSNIQAAGSVDEVIAAATAPTAADAERPNFADLRAMADRDAKINAQLAAAQGTPEGEALEQQRQANLPEGRASSAPQPEEPVRAGRPDRTANPAERLGQPVPGPEAMAQFDTLRKMGVDGMRIERIGEQFRVQVPPGALEQAMVPRGTSAPALPAPPMSDELVVDAQGVARQATQEELGGLGGRNITRIPRVEFAPEVMARLPAPVRPPALAQPTPRPALPDETGRPTGVMIADETGIARPQTQRERQALMAQRMREFELGKQTPRGVMSNAAAQQVEIAPAEPSKSAPVAAPAAANISKPPTEQVERRTDPARRRTVAEMSADEMRRELLTSELTGLGNRRAYDEAPKKAVQTSIDADSLKWINDNLGHEVGDQLLAKVGKAIKDAGAEGYHISGDEFRIQADSEEAANAVMQAVQKRLASTKLRGRLPDGTEVTKKGIGISYGNGKTIDESERALQRNKSERERSGLRPGRGAEPPGVRRSQPRQENPGGRGRADEGVSGSPAQGNQDRGNRRGKPVETNTGQLKQGMSEFRAGQVQRESMRSRPDLDWRVEPFGDTAERFQVSGYKKGQGGILESLPRKSDVLDGFVRGDIPGIGDAHAAPAPAILKALGAQSDTLVVPDSVLSDKALFRHGVSPKNLKGLLAQISEPVMVFDSETVENALVFLTEITNVQGRPVVVAIHLDRVIPKGVGRPLVVNRIATVTQKDNPVGAVSGWIERGLLRYEDKRKRPTWLPRAAGSNSLPTSASAKSGVGKKVIGPEDIVKSGAESRGAAKSAGPASAAAYRKRVDEITSKWRGAQDLNIQVVDRTEDVPEPYRPSALAEGVYHAQDGRVFLIAENIPTQKRLEEVLAHEVIGHYGVESVLGDQFADLVRDMKRLEPNRWAEAAADYSDQTEDVIAREVLARMAEDNVRPAFFERLYAMLREALRKLGFQLSMSNADLKQIIEDAGKFIRTGQAQDGDLTDAIRGVAYESRARAGVKQQARDALKDLFVSKKTFGVWSRTVGTQYGKAMRDEDFAKVFNETQAYVDDISYFANEAADQAPNLLPKLEHWTDAFKGVGADLSGARKADIAAVSEPIFEGTLGYKVYSDDELRTQFKLTSPQIKLYREFRASVDKSLDSLIISELARMARTAGADVNTIKDSATPSEALGKFNALVDDPAQQEAAFERVARVDELKAQGYAPLMRFGRYTVYATRGDEQLGFYTFETEREANRFRRELAQDLKDATIEQGVMSEEAFKLFQGISPDTLEVFGEAATIQAIDDAGNVQTVALKESPIYQEYLKLAVANRSNLKRLIKRKGVAGYSEDATRVLAAFLTSNARATSANYHTAQMSKAALDIPKGKGDVQDEAVRLVTYLRNPTEEAAQLRGFLFINYMGGSVASALVNMTQPVLMTFPYLSQWGAGKASAALLKGAKVASRGASGELGEAMKKAAEAGITEPHEIHSLYAESMRNFGSNMVWRRFLKVWGSFFSAAEAFNRKATFAAAWDMASKMSDTQLAEAGVADAYEFAIKAVKETQGIYSKANRPNWARGAVGATLFTFKQYSISYLEFLTRLPRAQQLQALALLVAVSGINGLPFGDDLDDLIDSLAQHLGYNWNTKEKKREWAAMLLGKEAANMALSGISSVPGIPLDVQGRLGMGNLIPGTGMLKRSSTDPARDVLEVAGPVGSLAKSAVDSGKALMGLDFGKALEGMAPTAIKNAAKAMDMVQTGMYRDMGGRKIVDTDLADAILKGIGFQPSGVAKVTRTERLVQEAVGLNKKVEGEIAERWAAGVFEKNPAKIREAMQELRDWNADNPESPIRITPQQIAKRVQSMQSTRAERIIKGAPRELRGVVSEELRP